MYMLDKDGWYVERFTWLIGGCMTLLSAALAAFVSPWWLILTAFVGVNLIVFATTGFCMMAIMLTKLGVKPRLGCDSCKSAVEFEPKRGRKGV